MLSNAERTGDSLESGKHEGVELWMRYPDSGVGDAEGEGRCHGGGDQLKTLLSLRGPWPVPRAVSVCAGGGGVWALQVQEACWSRGGGAFNVGLQSTVARHELMPLFPVLITTAQLLSPPT